MSTSIRYLRLYLHRPAQVDGGAPGEASTPTSQREAIGYLSQYGDILRVSFDESYIRNPQRPTLSLSFQGNDEAATQQILAFSLFMLLGPTKATHTAYLLFL